MAHFFGELQGSRGKATRLGTSVSGIRCHVRGWNVGVAIESDCVNGDDCFYVYATSGSHDRFGRTHVGTIGIDQTTGRPMFESAQGELVAF